MYSDSCSGQNKNSHMCASLISAVNDHPSLETIDHKFLVPGHTFMECDQIHAQIEKKKKKVTSEIHHSDSWFNFVRTVPYKKTHLLVREMKQEHFFDYASLLQQKKNGPLVMRDKNSNGEPFLFSPVQWFRFQKETPTTVLYKVDLGKDSAFKELNFRRRGKLGKQVLQPKQCYEQKLPISVLKKNDLLSLLPQINPIYHQFYQNLPASSKSKDIDPDIVPASLDIAEELAD
ncbi:5-methyltetrahydropteroyltriglutamate--homocysteine methyltransferase 2 [Frankliniella fusca]|uniref:5-methyltetrahydropteroyltriglutamate--homocysteine methyltransferase 2 n=1 Tax=Frankliniella fusca TaxID=407009 RepID=A0AAE1I279_9NEOP|nr:5-methyltetrahydropteroyltriglutamate--homocysteine methyltransferase 2 [Frankliniella fusca]